MFGRLANFVVKRHKAIVVFWVVVFAAVIVANQFWSVDEIVSYSLGGFIPKDTESAMADAIIEDQFPSGSLAVSSIVIVIVGQNTTTREVQNFTIDLDGMIRFSQDLTGQGDQVSYTLTNGRIVQITDPVRFLVDVDQATVYGIYRSTVSSLAQNLTGPLHDNVTYVQGLVNLYYLIPAYYVNMWISLGGSEADNWLSYNATMTFIGVSFPISEQPLAFSYFQIFAGYWNASFYDPRYSLATPIERGDGVIGDALPAYLQVAPFPPEAKAIQANFTNVFNMSNFSNTSLTENYTFMAFSSFTHVASPEFFEELFVTLPASPTQTEVETFSRSFILNSGYAELQALINLPFDASSFFFSPDFDISLMNYGFSRSPGYMEEDDDASPIEENVKTVREMVQLLKDETGFSYTVYTTGSAASELDESIVFSGSAEFIVTLVLVIILIGLYFRSFVSPFFPLGMIAIAIMISNLFIFLMGKYFFTIDFTTPAVLQTILLAAGTDYSIFLISRYRDERLDGKSREEAVRQSVTWAGESIATSGGAVLLSFATLGLASFPVVKTMGISIGFAITIALILCLTLVPSILLLVGNSIFWPFNRRMRKPKKIKSISRKYFAKSANFAMKHAKGVVLIALLISIPATYLVITEEAGYDFSKGVPKTESSEGLDAMSEAFGAGYFFKSYVVIQFPDDLILAGDDLDIPKMYALENLTGGLMADNGAIKAVYGPANPEGTIVPYRSWNTLAPQEKQQIIDDMRPHVGVDNRTVRVDIVLNTSVFSGEAVGAVDRIGDDVDRIKNQEPALRYTTTYVGGATATINDIAESTNNDLKIMAVVVAIGLFLILMVVLGSVLIPLRAIITILLSITWTLGTTILLFQVWRGLEMVFVLPLIVFVLAMGLGMDYDIFIITRVREEVAKGRTDREAILISISRTGGIISACGIIMAGAFATLMLSPLPFLQQMGFALAFVVLIDSMIVRIYLVPAIMVLAGKYNWWAPKFLQRVRRPANSERDAPHKKK